MNLVVTIDGTDDPAEIAFALQHLAARIRDESGDEGVTDEMLAAPLLDSGRNDVGSAALEE
jgi:hypothetical protein